MRVSVGRCVLCGQRAPSPLRDAQGREFCCPACREVFHLLAQKPAEEVRPPEEGVAQEGVLGLGGLWCKSCALLIEGALKRVRGVREVQVSLLHEEARVVYDPRVTDLARCARVVRRLGYRAWLPGQKRADEEEALSFRLLFSGVLAMHVMFVSIALYLREWLGWSTPDSAWLDGFFRVILLLGSAPVVALLAPPVVRAGLGALARGQPSMHTLIGLGALSAFALSVRNLAVGNPSVYFDTATMLLVLVTLGHWFELRARKWARGAVAELGGGLPSTARVVTPQGIEARPLGEVRPGMRVRVVPGDTVPTDGLVAQGDAEVDEALLTGEPGPRPKGQGEAVLAGAKVVEGSLDLIVTAVGGETVLGRAAQALRKALWQRALLERLADRVSAVMVPLAVALAGSTFLLWTARAGLETGLVTALSVLVVACPCALGLATPLALWVGMGRAGRAGVVVKHPGALEALARVRSLYLDKTGTLTRRSMRVEALYPANGDPYRALQALASLEQDREHPVARALMAEARRRGAYPRPAQGVQRLPGRGVKGRVDRMVALVGNQRLMEEEGVAVPPSLTGKAREWAARGCTVAFVALGGQVVAGIALAEEPRPEAPSALRRLRALGLEVALLTGDSESSARRWGERLEVPAYGGLDPTTKVERLRQAPAPQAMVGDGANDAPALATADVGIALSGGAEEARSAAQVVLVREDLRLLPWLVALARSTLHTVRWNLGWAFGYNSIGIGVAMAGLLHPAVAAGAMVLSSLLVTANSLRLRRFPDP